MGSGKGDQDPLLQARLLLNHGLPRHSTHGFVAAPPVASVRESGVLHELSPRHITNKQHALQGPQNK